MSTKIWLDYTIHAMNPVKKEITNKMMEQSTMIESLLKPVFVRLGIQADFFVIGSVAAQTHIEPNNSIDILVLLEIGEDSIIVDDETVIDQMVLLKHLVKDQIISRFPEAKFSNSHSLSLKMFHQNLSCILCLYFGYRQKIKDNAPGISSTSAKIKLLNFENRELSDMDPFQNLLQISHKDKLVNQNVKPLIRILKNIKNNSLLPIDLTGHELTSIVFSMDNYLLEKPNGQLLFILLECSMFLRKLEDNLFLQRNLKSPDMDPIITSENEMRILKGIHLLKNELDQLIKNLVLEIDLYTNISEYTAINS